MAEQSPKRYEPSSRKLQYLRSRGIHASSPMFSGLLAVLCGGLAVVVFARHGIIGPLTELLRTGLSGCEMGTEEMVQRFGDGMAVAALAVLPAGLGALVGWFAGNTLQTGFALRWPGASSEGPRYYTIPRQGGGDIAVRAILAVMLLVGTFVAIVGICGAAAMSATMPWQGLVSAYLWPVLSSFIPVLGAVIMLDLVWCRYSYMSAAAMSENEHRQEVRESGTSWLTGWRRDKARRDGGKR
jgi:flagellar biosynthesis protein FlhB